VFTSSERDTVEWGAAEVGTQLSETARVYEWRIDLHSEFLRESDVAAPDLAAGTTLGFDVTVADRDHDGSLSWMMWGPGVGKVWGSRFSRRGDAVLVTEAVVMGRLDGRAAWTDPLESKPPTAVLVQPDSGATRWVAATDDDGVFSVGVPVGGYVLSLDDERLGRDRRLTTARVAAGAPTTVTVVDEPLFPADLRERALQRAPILKPPPAGKQHGVSWVGSRIVGRAEVASLEQAKAAWIVQTPFGWQRDVKAPVLRAPTGEAGLWGESDRGVAITTALSRERGVATLLKPHIWTGRDTWRGELAMSTEEDWATWFDQYETFIVHYARLAEATGIEGLCIGTELSATVHREAEWRRVIEGVREVYGGWLVYAANWNTFEKVPFWDAVDFIGVQAYFPLSEVATDDVDTLVAGWQPWLSRLQAAAQATDRRVLFTEIGYRTNANAAVEPWLWERQTEGGGDATGQRTQAACYEAFFRAAWHHDWVAGAYFWKWFPHHDRAGGGDDDGFTPQNKLAQQVLADWYGRPLRQPVFPTAGPASSAASE
jgi:hypothetical protein